MIYKKVLKKISILQSNPQFREIVVNMSWLCADKIVRMGLGLTILVWVARYLGVEQYGIFNYSLAFVALFSPFATVGLDNIVIKYIIRDSSNRDQILGTAFWLKLLGGATSLLLAVGCMFLFRPDDRLTIELVAILSTAGFFQAFDTIDLWFQSQVQSKYTVFSKNTAFVLVTFLQIVLIIIQAPLIIFAWVKIVEFSIGSIGLLIAYKSTGYSIRSWRWSFPLAKILLQESWYLIIAGVGTMIYMRIDQIMLGEMVGNKAVGIYSAATRIAEVWYFIPMAISSSIMPSVFRAKQISEDLYHDQLRKTISLLLILSLIVSCTVTFYSSSLVTLLFGNSYIESGQILSIYIWASVFISMAVGGSSWFIAENCTHVALKITLIAAMINIILNLLLIPQYGGIGAAIATVISQMFASFLAYAIYPETRKLFSIQIMSLNLLSRI